jgi:CDP-glucose 4,6-dehydratase
VAIISAAFWRARSVLVTGHTGFKGGWLTLWLHALGAHIHGYALDPITRPSLLEAARIASLTANDTRADLADFGQLSAVFGQAQPSVVFHLAAQPLVRESYRDPVRTFATNVLGTAHVLEAARRTPSVAAVVIVTTDKVYVQREGARPYTEDDPLGGHDPYSASKAAAEIITASYRSSFFGGHADMPARVATARAGNVIGGGDWAADRLIPDCVRAFIGGQPASLRFPHAVRPWQHVLEPLSGYLQLAERLAGPDGVRYGQAWNFGPDGRSDATVTQVAHLLAGMWGSGAAVLHAPSAGDPHEADALRLDSSRACRDLGWRPRWSLHEGLEHTIAWYRAWDRREDMVEVSARQIAEYVGASQI